jgi:hypothetical protein
MADWNSSEPKPKSIPITGRSIFISERKTQIESDNSEMTKLEIFRMLGDQWDQMDGTTRSKYEKKADYLRRTESRKTSFARKHKKDGNEARISAFSIFTRERHEVLKKENPELTLTDRGRLISNEWKLMSKLDKIPFINVAKRETRSIRRSLPSEDSESSEESS